MQAKLWAIHAEADRLPELISKVEGALEELKAKVAPVVTGGNGTPEPTPISKGKGKGKPPAEESAPRTEEKAAPRVTFDQVKNRLTDLKTAVDSHHGEEKKLGIKEVKAILEKYKVTNSKDLTEDQYAPILADIEEKLNKISEEF